MFTTSVYTSLLTTTYMSGISINLRSFIQYIIKLYLKISSYTSEVSIKIINVT